MCVSVLKIRMAAIRNRLRKDQPGLKAESEWALQFIDKGLSYLTGHPFRSRTKGFEEKLPDHSNNQVFAFKKKWTGMFET